VLLAFDLLQVFIRVCCSGQFQTDILLRRSDETSATLRMVQKYIVLLYRDYGTVPIFSVTKNDFISNHSFTIFAKCEFNVNSYCAAVFRKHCNSGNL